jgi:uncharacterized protein (TIGR03437 family)
MRRWTPLVFCVAAHAAGLTMPDQSAIPGQMVVLTLSLASQGQSISAIQFDIDADAGLSFGDLPGVQIGASGKALYSAALPNRGLRVLVAGINNQQIADGELLRPVVLVDPAAFPGPAQVRIGNVVATDPNGQSVEISSTAATVQIGTGSAAQSFSAGTVVNAASFLSGPVSPGEIVTIFGGADLAAASDVRVNGSSAPVLYAGPGQVNAIVPFGLDPNQTAKLEVLSPSGSLGTLNLSGAAVSPALFTESSNGSGPGAVLNADYTLNSYSNPASRGSIVMLYGTGFGPVSPATPDGQTATGQARTVLPVSAFIGGLATDVLYAGAAPGEIAGVTQINLRVPANAAPSPAAPVVLRIGGIAATGVTISIQ